MRERFSGSMVAVAIAATAVSAVISVPVSRTSAQAPTASGTRRRKHLGANQTFKEFGPTNLIHPYNAPPSMRTRNSSPRRSERK